MSYHCSILVDDGLKLEGVRENLVFRDNVPVNDHFYDELFELVKS